MVGDRPGTDEQLQGLLGLLHGGTVDDSGKPVQLSADSLIWSLQDAGVDLKGVSQALLHAGSTLPQGCHIFDLEKALREGLRASDHTLPIILRPLTIREFIRHRYDERLGMIFGADGNKEPFRVNEIADSLYSAGGTFLDILAALEAVEPGLRPGMTTGEVQKLVSDHLRRTNPDLADRFDALYVTGYMIEFEDRPFTPLTDKVVRALIKDWFVARVGRQVAVGAFTLRELTALLVKRFRSRPERVAKASDIEKALHEELKERWGRNLKELDQEFPLLVKEAREYLVQFKTDAAACLPADGLGACMERIEHVTQAVLLKYDYVPGFDRADTLGRAVGLIDGTLPLLEESRKGPALSGEEAVSPLARDVAMWLYVQRLTGSQPAGHLANVTGFLGWVRSAYQILQTLDRDNPLEGKEAEVKEAIGAVHALLEAISYAQLLDVEDSPPPDDILRHLYRCRYCDFYDLTRDLRILPKHLIGALWYLGHEGRIKLYTLTRDVAVELSEKGEKYCREELGLGERWC